jgi:serine/threonine protein phosphatase 1
MASYVISDIHGEYGKFVRLLEKIGLSEADTLYVLGDVVDRGPEPVRVLLRMMEMPNVVPIVGNHELMALACLETLREEITEDLLDRLSDEMLLRIQNWIQNGARTTIEAFRKLDREMQDEVLDFLREFLAYEEVKAGGKRFLLVHAGLGNFRRGRPMEDYALDELVWDRPDYGIRYFPDMEVVSGHTPTQLIAENPRKGYVFRTNGHVAIDCGACFRGGRLAAICLETGEEYYEEQE